VVDAWREEFQSAFEGEYAGASSYIPQPQEWLASNWQGEALGGAGAKKNVVPTGLPMETLKHVVSRGPRQDRRVGPEEWRNGQPASAFCHQSSRIVSSAESLNEDH
jgi:hypothetical protein